jgi:integrase
MKRRAGTDNTFATRLRRRAGRGQMARGTRAGCVRVWEHPGRLPADDQTAWETLKLLANGLEPKAGEEGVKWNAEQLRRIDLRWHDLRHEGACRLLADGVDIRMIQLMLGHASIQQTQRYLNVTDEELRKGLEVSPRGI